MFYPWVTQFSIGNIQIVNIMDTIANQTATQAPALPVNTGGFTNERERMGLPPFFQFVFKNKSNKEYFLIALFGGILQIVFFKILYPFPDFISDSYSYIDTNLYHMSVNLWPIGYSKFLWLIHAITPSDTFLVVCQYFLLQASMLYFFFTVLYLYGLKKNHANILFIFLFFNPLFLWLSNCVLSDALFCAISLVLFTQNMFMFHKPKLHHIIVSTVLIGLVFTIRYTAIYYPIVSAIAFLLSRHRIPLKLAGIISPWLLIIPFILYTQQETKKVTGTSEFSVFGGWQIANNALYMREHINVDSTRLPAGTRELDRLAMKYFQIVPPEQRQLAPLPGTFFMKVQNAILKPYMLMRYSFSDAPGQFKAWGQVSAVYKEYGTYLINHYPRAFAQYYLWLNTKNYFIPHLEKFSNYNLYMDSVFDDAREWFHLKSNSITKQASSELQSHLFFFYPPLFMMLNLYFISSFLFILFSGKLIKIQRKLVLALLVTVAFLCINFGFSIFATPVVLRYQVFPMILLVCFSLFLTETLDLTNKAIKN